MFNRTKPILNHIKPSSFIHFGAWSFRHIMTHGDLQKAAGEFLVRHTGGMDHPLMLLRRSLGWGHQQPLSVSIRPSVHPSYLPTYIWFTYDLLKVPSQKKTEHGIFYHFFWDRKLRFPHLHQDGGGGGRDGADCSGAVKMLGKAWKSWERPVIYGILVGF